MSIKPDLMEWILSCLLLLPLSSNGTVYYVSPDGDNSDGESWSTAYTSLSNGLSACGDGDQVWVEEGTYTPTSGSDRSSTFTISEGCSVYGGFDGTESNRNNRNGGDTILDGNIGNNNDNTDNVYHVVIMESDSKLDRFIIKNGYAINDNDPTDYETNSGGGIYMKSTSTTINLKSITFTDNTATQGGALYILGSTNKGSTVDSCTFTNNEALASDYRGGTGGAIHLAYSADMTITDSTFQFNKAYYRGGAIYEDYGSDVTITSSDLLNNRCFNGHGGAIFVEDRNSQFGSTRLSMVNSNVKHNRADRYGGGIFVFNEAYGNFTELTVQNNSAEYYGGIGIYSANIDQTDGCKDCTYSQNSATLDSSTNDFGEDDFDYFNNVTFGRYSESQYLSDLWTVSQTSGVSLEEKSSSGTIIYVDASNSGNNQDGSTWNKAYDVLQDAIDDLCNRTNPSDVEIWVVGGEYSPTSVPEWSDNTTPRYRSFVLCEDTTIYGGFSGDETNRNERNWNDNPTYFSSKTGKNGGNTAQQIVIGAHNSRIDGMIFKRGYSSLSDDRRRMSNEIRNDRRRLSGTTSISSVISETSRLRGAGLFVNASDMYIVNSLFIENYGYKGGGAYCMGYKSDGDYRWPRFYNVAFINNGAGLRGGAIAGDAYCDFTCEKCVMVGNFANEKGGAVYLDFVAGPSFDQSTWEDNYALEAGGAVGLDGGGTLIVTDSTAITNEANWSGGAFYSGSFNINNEQQSMSFVNVSLGNNICHNCNTDFFVWGNGEIYLEQIDENALTQPTDQPTDRPTNVPVENMGMQTTDTYTNKNPENTDNPGERYLPSLTISLFTSIYALFIIIKF